MRRAWASTREQIGTEPGDVIVESGQSIEESTTSEAYTFFTHSRKQSMLTDDDTFESMT